MRALLIVIEAGHILSPKASSRKDRELKHLTCSINYDTRKGMPVEEDLRKGWHLSMKPKILSWNVWGLNDPNRQLQVKNLLNH